MLKHRRLFLISAMAAAVMVSAPWAAAQMATQPKQEVKPAQPTKTATPSAPKQPTTGSAPPTGNGDRSKSPFGGSVFLFIILGAFVLLYFLSSRSRKKQEAKRKEMLGSIRKGDKIITIGGILGTVMDSRDTEIIVKVDEQNNIRMRFAKWAVRAVGEEARKVDSGDQQR